MTRQQYLAQVRQYAQLSQRKHKSYAPMVDALTDEFKASLVADGVDGGDTSVSVDAMRDREYNPLYRGYPLSRPTD